jgi:hypothetical protein
VRSFAKEQRSPHNTLLYMFSGPDALHALALFPNATTYVMPTRVPQFMARTIRPHMPMVGEYRRYAAECLTLRAMITGSRQRAVLLSMAVSWSDLSEMAEKNEQNDIVYETPTGRASATLH